MHEAYVISTFNIYSYKVHVCKIHEVYVQPASAQTVFGFQMSVTWLILEMPLMYI